MCSKHYWLIINNRIHASSWCRFQVVENAQLNWLRPISSTALVLVRRTSAHDCLFIYEHELMQSTFDIYNEKSWFMKSFAHILFALWAGAPPTLYCYGLWTPFHEGPRSFPSKFPFLNWGFKRPLFKWWLIFRSTIQICYYQTWCVSYSVRIPTS